MKSLSDFILESIDAKKSVDSILKKLVGKAVKLDELKKNDAFKGAWMLTSK